MKVGEIVDRVLGIFGDEAGVLIETKDILAWVNDGQMEVARQTECLEGEDSWAIDGALYPYYKFPTPTDLLSVKRVTYAGIPLSKTTLEEVDTLKLDSRAKDTPRYWYIWKSQLNLFPIPPKDDLTTSIVFSYVRLPHQVRAISDDMDVPVPFYEDIVRYALIRAREKNEDYSEAARLSGEFQSRMLQSRDEANQVAQSYPVIRDIYEDYYF